MLGIRLNFVRRFFRRIMSPMTVEEAQLKKLNLSKAYFCISLMTFGCVVYQVKKGRLDWVESEGLIPENEAKLSPAFQYAKMLGVQQATVIRVKGTEILNTKEYNKETFDVAEHVKEEESSSTDPMTKFIKM